MNPQQFFVTAACTAVVLGGLPCIRLDAQSSGAARSQLVWENDRLSVGRLSLAPGETFSSDSPGGTVIVFLTADLDGRMPRAEAAWRESGVVTMENHGRARFDAVVVSLKAGEPRSFGVTPPEVVRAAETFRQMTGYTGTYGMMVDARTLIRNQHVSVTKHRYLGGAPAYFEPLHFHPQDAVVIYLRGGDTWPTTWYYGSDRVRRGDIRVVPGNVYHTVGNPGSDPLEFLLIMPT